SLIIILLAVLYRKKVISYVTSQLRIISDNRVLFIAATIVGISTFILILGIIRKNESFVRTDVETEDVRINGQIQDSWDEIIAVIDKGEAQSRYAIGAYKQLDLGQFGTINMRLAGFNLDKRADGQGKAVTTWIAKEILPKVHRWNPRREGDKVGTGTIGGWEKCELRRWMNETILPSIPGNVRGRLVPVKKIQESYDSKRSSIEQTTEDRIWIPSYDEVFGDRWLDYRLFRDQNDRRIKTRNGSAAWWWLRSASTNFSAYAVYNSGNSYSSPVSTTSGGVVISFCL
ncbi:MAG: DUF6273 domain-containing protein, partial [bacterium]